MSVELKPCPCKDCDTRKTYALLFDVHISGDDCPYVCEKYERWAAEGRTHERYVQNILA